MRTRIKTIVNKFAISNHTALILGVLALGSYLKLICEYELRSLPNKKAGGAKDHGKNYMKVRPPQVRHLLRNPLSKQNKKLNAIFTFLLIIFEIFQLCSRIRYCLVVKNTTDILRTKEMLHFELS